MKSVSYFTPVIAAILLVSCFVTGLWHWNSQKVRVEEFDPNQLSPEDRSRVACGPVALALAAQVSGISVEPATLINDCELTPNGASPDELKRLAAKHGFIVKQMKWSWEQLASHAAPVVLHVDGTHYVAANPAEPRDTSPEGKDSIRVYDPGGSANWWSREALLARWNGLTLTVEAQAAREGLGVDQWWVDLGHRDCSKQATFSIPVRNDYSAPVILQIAHTSCECTSAKFDVLELSPGESSTLAASVNLGKKRGPFRERVRFTSQTGEQSREWCVTLAGTAIGNVEFSSREIALGDLRPGKSKSASVVLRDAGDASLRLLSVEPVASDLKTAEFTNVKFKHVTTSLAAEFHRKHPVIQEHDWLITLDVTAVDPNYKGKFVGELIVEGTRIIESRRHEFRMSCPIIGWVK